VAAPRHTADEEESLFPRLRSAGAEAAIQAVEEIRRLEADHERADACHAEANALAGRWLSEGTLPSAETNRLAELLEALTAIYREHIAIEDSRVFPAAAAALPADELEAVGREMAARLVLDFDRVVGQDPGFRRKP
jgi:hemerythrin-like domain-containing protein